MVAFVYIISKGLIQTSVQFYSLHRPVLTSVIAKITDAFLYNQGEICASTFKLSKLRYKYTTIADSDCIDVNIISTRCILGAQF